MGTAVAAAGLEALPSLAGAQSASGDTTFDQLSSATSYPRRRILIKGATILSMDSAVGDFVEGDLLIEGKKIAAVSAARTVPPPLRFLFACPGFFIASSIGELKRAKAR